MTKDKKNRIKMTNTPDELLKNPYARILTPDPQGHGYSAEILEFPGCFAEGDTPDEAYKNLEKSATAWIEAALDMGQEIPEPSISQGFSGKIALRLPRSLHRRAVQIAERNRTSLNQYLLSAISEHVGATNLYSHLLEELNRQTAQMFVTLKTTTVAFEQNYVIFASSNLFPFPIDTKSFAPYIQNINVLGQHEGNQQHA